jgi:beta-glucosidase
LTGRWYRTGALCTIMNAGNDMDMPGPRGKEKLVQAVADGTLPMERLDDAVARTLRMILKAPAFCGKRYTKINEALSSRAAYHAAVEGITLLKNNGVLPLARNTKTALFGHLSDRFMESGSGSAQVDTNKSTHLPDELRRYTDCVLRDTLSDDTQVAIITAGASGQEGRDRPAMDFDEADKAMLADAIFTAKRAGKKVVLVLNVAGPVELQAYMDSIDALVCIYFPGMEGAKALADILFGTVSPSGKLPITFPKTYRQTPTAINFPGEYGQVYYGEGIFVGYRYYDYKGLDPLFPFGFGLSYSTFTMRDVTLSQSTYHNQSTQPLIVRVTVKNEGAVEAKEVVQLYLHCCGSTLVKPEQELKAFQKVSLLPGEEKAVSLQLLPRDFASYDTEHQAWITEPGHYTLSIGNSSRNLLAKADLTVTGPNPYLCSVHSPIATIMQNDAAMQVCQRFFGDCFDLEKLKSNVLYFGATPLKKYLFTAIPEIDRSEAGFAKIMADLQAQLDLACQPDA